jgi:hypothetical protein
MNHEEYLARLEAPDDAGSEAVLAHVASCRLCRREQAFAESALRRLEPGRQSPVAQTAQWVAAAAVILVVALGFLELSRRDEPETKAVAAARYRIVGNSSGVVAYTPSGVVTGSVAPVRDREVER